MSNPNVEEGTSSDIVGLSEINVPNNGLSNPNGPRINVEEFVNRPEFHPGGPQATGPRKPKSGRLGSLNGEYPLSSGSQGSEVIDLTLLDEERDNKQAQKALESNVIPPVSESLDDKPQHDKASKGGEEEEKEEEEDDDEIVELDPQEATKITAFKERSHKRLFHSPLLNDPAPVPHFPPNYLAKLNSLRQALSQRRLLLTEKQIALGSYARKMNALMQIFHRLKKEEQDNEQLIRIQSTGALDPQDIQKRLLENKKQMRALYHDRAVQQEQIESLKRMIHMLERDVQAEQNKYDVKPQIGGSTDRKILSDVDIKREELRKRYRMDVGLLQQAPGSSQSSQSHGVFGSSNGFLETADDQNDAQSVIREWENQQDVQVVGPAYYTNGQNNEESSHLSELLDNIKPDLPEDDDNDGQPSKPEGMITDLYKHQKIGLSWLVRMEKSKSKGGLLADAMGLGKTIQTIALIMAHKSEDLDCKTTLIIAPVSLLRQWYNEIKLHTTGVSVGLYHGTGKKQFKTFRDIKRFDVIMTSYTTLSYEFRRHYAKIFNENRISFTQNFIPDHGTGGDEYCSPFYSTDSHFYRIVLDEAQNIKNKVTIACKSVTTLSAKYRLCLTGTPMQNSIDELFPIIRFLRIKPYSREESFKVNISQPLKSDKSDEYDKSVSMNRLRALLRAILLRRNKDSKIDGKPILNLPEKHIIDKQVTMEPDEFETYQSIEKQLQTRAKRLLMEDGNFSNFLVLLLRLRQACCHTFLCEIGSVGKFEQFRFENIDNLCKAVERINLETKESITADLVSCLGDEITKGDTTTVAETKHESDDDVELIELLSSQQNNLKSEVNVSEDVLQFGFDSTPLGDIGTPDKFDVKQETASGSLDEEEKSEAISSHNGELKTEHADDSDMDVEMNFDQFKTDEEGVFTCSICFISYTFESAIRFPCNHKVCEDCIASFVEENKVDEKSVKCVECQDTFPTDRLIDYKTFKMKVIDGKSKYEIRTYVEECFKGKLSVAEKIKKLIVKHQGLVYSTKMQEALNLIEKILVDYPGEKIILFSQFTTFFDLLKFMFNKAGIPTLRYDGTMSLEKKDLTVQQFYQNPKYKIMLTSLKAGNVGLTLNCASHVIILDPFWNPYVEEQAMDRAHRIGQKREVFVYRILIQNTVEERIITLQNKKKSLINAAMDEKSIQSVSNLSRQDLRYLFGI